MWLVFWLYLKFNAITHTPIQNLIMFRIDAAFGLHNSWPRGRLSCTVKSEIAARCCLLHRVFNLALHSLGNEYENLLFHPNQKLVSTFVMHILEDS